MTPEMLPFNPFREGIYSRQELWSGYDSIPANNTSLDWRIYEYFRGTSKYSPSRLELIAQRTHDANIETAINEFFEIDETAAPKTKKPVVLV